MSFPRYPAYKDSGVEWLGEIPAHWEVNRFRYLFRESDEKIEHEVVGPMLSVSGYRGVEIKEYDDENRKRSEEQLVGYRIVRVGQLVVNTMWLNHGGLGISRHEGHVSPAYRSYRVHEGLELTFVHHLLRADLDIEGYTQLLTGIRPNSLQMSREDLMAFPILLPPRSDQAQIAAFLDGETAKINSLISEQRRLIELLKEKRQAVISHAVTKGLDPRARMKPSGIEWLGDVPSHWSVVRIKSVVAAFDQGWSPQCEAVPAETGEWGVLKVGCVNGGIFRPSENKLLPAELEPIPALGIVAGDVLVSRANTRELVGSAVAVQEDFPQLMLCDKLYRLRVGPRCVPDFLASYLQSDVARSRIELEASGASASMLNIAQSTILEMPMPLPPRNEQDGIVGLLRDSAERLGKLIAEAERAIDLLQERRTALVSAAVTGKIDVRGLGRADVPEQAEAA